jgi:hypothetical protein
MTASLKVLVWSFIHKLEGEGLARIYWQNLHAIWQGEADYLLAETRTAGAGGWKSVKRCDFMPIGYEPFAHATPVGNEAMLMAAQISKAALAKRSSALVCSRDVSPLAQLVLSGFDTPQVRVEDGKPYATNVHDWVETVGEDFNASAESCLDIRRDDRAGIELLKTWPRRWAHESGVVCLRRLEGEDRFGIRYDRQHYVGQVNGQPVACARVVWDGNDHRARILELHTKSHGLQGLVIAQIIKELEGDLNGQGITLVVDVLASNIDLQLTLKELGFFPSIYYPALVAHNGDENGVRDDAVQFTRLLGGDLQHADAVADELVWDEARALMMTVVQGREG